MALIINRLCFFVIEQTTIYNFEVNQWFLPIVQKIINYMYQKKKMKNFSEIFRGPSETFICKKHKSKSYKIYVYKQSSLRSRLVLNK